MHRNVELLIGRLVTDSELREHFEACPLQALLQEGLELNEVEIAALAATDPEAFRTLAAALDVRLRKSPRAAIPVPSRGTDTLRLESESTKETP